MAILGQWLVLLHVISAFALTGGLIGREVTLAYAWRQEKVELFAELYTLSRWFDTRITSPASHAILLFGLLAAWVRGWPILGVLQGSSINWVFVSLLLYLSLVLPVIYVLIPRGKLFRRRLADALAQNSFTHELRASMNDPVVRAAQFYEAAVVVVVVYLMVMKPF